MERTIDGLHNQPPDSIDEALAPFGDALAEAENYLDGSPCETEAQVAAVDDLAKQVKAARKAVMLAEESECRPLWDAHKAAKARYKPTLDDLDRIIKGLVAAVDGYKRTLAEAKEAAKREAQRLAWEAAGEARRAAEAANVADLTAQREAAAAQAAFEAAQARAKAAEADTVRGMRTYEEQEIEDASAALRWVWLNDRAPLEAWLVEYVRKSRATIPGVIRRKVKRAI